MINPSVMIANDEAVDNFLSGKRNLAAYQFSELIRDFIESNVHVNDGSADCTAYNYALVNLFTGCPQRASAIFKDLVDRYPKNPRLWLRLAESSLATERLKLDKFDHVQQLANGDMCKLLLKTNNTPIFIKVNPNYHQQFIQQHHQQRKINSESPAKFLATVLNQLKQAFSLISEYNLSQFKDTPSIMTGDSETPTLMLNDSNNHNDIDSFSSHLSFETPNLSISRSDLIALKIKLHINMAYVYLCMNDPTQALEQSTTCLNMQPSGYEKVLANLYHAEACILLGRVEEAIQFLNKEIFDSANSLSKNHPIVANSLTKSSNASNSPTIGPQASRQIVYGDDLKQQLESGAPSMVLKYNLSVAYATKGNIQKANELLLNFVDPNKSNPMQILICLLYLQLQQGQLEMAKKTVLNNLPQFR